MDPALDIAIVGAGPSGAWTAYQLARRGARVRVFDGSHPREKPCGGGVTGRALDLVKDAVDRNALQRVEVLRACFTCGADASRSTVELPHNALAIASRREFDGALLEASRRAGAEHVQTRVRRITREARGFRIETTDGRAHLATFIVGADGANSLVRRTLAAPFRRDQLSVATGFFAHGVTSDEVVIEFTSNPPGYLWSFPRPDHLAIGVCAQADAGVSSSVLQQQASRWIGREKLAAGAHLEPYAWPIPSLSREDFGALTLAGDDWALVGDAAGLVDPITREGIFFALQSAQYLADALLLKAFRAGYVERVHDQIGADLAEGARLKTVFFHPAFVRLLTRALDRSGRIRAVLADLVAGTQPYRTLKWRLAQTLELRLAIEMLLTRREGRFGASRRAALDP